MPREGAVGSIFRGAFETLFQCWCSARVEMVGEIVFVVVRKWGPCEIGLLGPLFHTLKEARPMKDHLRCILPRRKQKCHFTVLKIERKSKSDHLCSSGGVSLARQRRHRLVRQFPETPRRGVFRCTTLCRFQKRMLMPNGLMTFSCQG